MLADGRKSMKFIRDPDEPAKRLDNYDLILYFDPFKCVLRCHLMTSASDSQLLFYIHFVDFLLSLGTSCSQVFDLIPWGFEWKKRRTIEQLYLPKKGLTHRNFQSC